MRAAEEGQVDVLLVLLTRQASADTADRMVDDVLQQGRLAVVPQAGHSVMTDNPEGFREALEPFLLA